AAAVPAGIATERESEHHDDPVSFDPALREYGWRTVAHDRVSVANDEACDRFASEHNPMALLGGA
ncbi:MAG TPA: hypothetical protein VIH37_11250, partial [Candidatus Limnocylindrales bacterium]